MARTIECGVALVKKGLALPLPGLELNGKTPVDYLNASANAAGAERLKLIISFPTNHDPKLQEDDLAYASHLHTFLESVTKNIDQVGPAKRIGLLLSDYWPYDHTILGVMLDTWFNTGFTPGGGFAAVPREGCVIFLKALRDLRPNDQDYQREAFFTCVHELGHVFNLWHDFSGPNFLQWPDANQPTPDDAFTFSAEHKKYLSNVESAPEVYPGGSDFGARGNLGPAGSEEAVHLRARRSRRSLELRISPSQFELAYFEPLELDIEIRSASAGSAPTVVPSRIDPGYSEFAVWIECPDGSRRCYRPPRRYCGGTSRLTIGPGRPFRRDLSLFVESGGFTFRSQGEHHVYATCLLPDRTVLRSNKIALNVRGRYGSTSFADHVQEILTRPGPVRLLYHRNGRFHPSYIQTLEELARRSPDPMLKANLYYALGRYFETAGRRVGAGRWARDHRKKARTALGRALDRAELSVQRRRNATRCVKQLEE
jgi:hypothetical protein